LKESYYKQEMMQLQGGGDCPELAATGIIAGIEAVKPKSHLYFFSDASAKDGPTLGPTAKRMALSTGCRVNRYLSCSQSMQL